MTVRKTPILLRRGPLTGRIFAAYRYKKHSPEGGWDGIEIANDGKEDVTADFDALVCELLLEPDARGIVTILGDTARGRGLSIEDRQQVRSFHKRLKGIVERHNQEGWGAKEEGKVA